MDSLTFLFRFQVTNSMIKLLYFCFQVTNSRLKNKKIHFELLTRWVRFCFPIFELQNVKLINEKNFLKIRVLK